MKQKWVDAYMDVAQRFAELSHGKRLQVGAVVVKDSRIISIGYNGTPSGWDNSCETIVFAADDDIKSPDEMKKLGYIGTDEGWYRLFTRPSVIHAEANCISKLASSTESGKDAEMFVTHAPCVECSKMIYGAGIKKVYYRNSYRNNDGLEFLEKCNIEISQVRSN